MKVSYKLDILKPHRPGNDAIARQLIELNGVSSVKITVDEIDQKTTSVFVQINGNKDMSLEQIEAKLEELNCALHSVDEVIIQKEERDY
ncbi:MAG: DUF211 domain-containing protein [Promethearchaeota archaeon]